MGDVKSYEKCGTSDASHRILQEAGSAHALDDLEKETSYAVQPLAQMEEVRSRRRTGPCS